MFGDNYEIPTPVFLFLYPLKAKIICFFLPCVHNFLILEYRYSYLVNCLFANQKTFEND